MFFCRVSGRLTSFNEPLTISVVSVFLMRTWWSDTTISSGLGQQCRDGARFHLETFQSPDVFFYVRLTSFAELSMIFVCLKPSVR